MSTKVAKRKIKRVVEPDVRLDMDELRDKARAGRPLHHSKCDCLQLHAMACGRKKQAKAKRRKDGKGVKRDSEEFVITNHCYNDGMFAQDLGVSQRTVYRWIKEGGIPAKRADELACRIGFTPQEVWGDDWERYIDDLVEAFFEANPEAEYDEPEPEIETDYEMAEVA